METRIYGKLKTWNTDKGFGFITPDNGGQEIFVHISDYPRQGGRPVVGESLSFEIALNKDGKKKATNVQRPRLQSTPPVRAHNREPSKNGMLSGLASLIVVGLIVYFGYQAFTQKRHSEIAPLTTTTAVQADAPIKPTVTFTCDGRRHCSQMTSCAEATFFLRHCPDTKMDGDNDGIPCEEQWCSGALAR